MSIWHWVIVLAIILILFGPGKLPDVFRQAGKGIKAFKDASEGRDEKARAAADEDADVDEEEEIRQEIRRRKAERRKQIAAKDVPDELDDDASDRAASTTPRKGKSES